MATFNERLRQLRKEKHLTLDELAVDLKTTKTTLSRYENDLRDPKSEIVNQFADYFGVTTDYMLGKSDVRNLNIDSEIQKLKENVVRLQEYLPLIKKIKDNDLDINVVNAVIDALIMQKKA